MSEQSVNITRKNNELAEFRDSYTNLVFNTPEEILAYGEEASIGISRFADEILSQMRLSSTEKTGKLLSALNELMTTFDKGDFGHHEEKGLFNKIFQIAKKNASNFFEKYDTFNNEIDKIFIEIKKYEYEIKDTNEMLNNMYEQNMQYYSQLEEYIENASNLLKSEIEPKIESLVQASEDPENGAKKIELGKVMEIKDTLEQRIYDLEIAKAVSLQTAPQIKLIQKGNYNLVRKISSAFVITMPLFKQGIIQAITLKRQKVQMDSMSALDESTNRLLKQNANNVVENAKLSTKLNSNGSIRIETLEESYNTIINGIKEVRDLQAANQKQRQEGINKMKELKTCLLTGKALTQTEEQE